MSARRPLSRVFVNPARAQAEITAEIEALATERPELYKAILAKIAEADKPGIAATVSAAKDPSTCKYTEEGTMVHDMMQRVAKADRRMKLVAELELALTAKDKADLAATIQADVLESLESGYAGYSMAAEKSLKVKLPDRPKDTKVTIAIPKVGPADLPDSVKLTL